MSAGFTPGPWFAERRTHCSIVRQYAVRDSYSSRIAECPQWSPSPRNQPCPDEAFANASLIAAAPELYAALEAKLSARVHSERVAADALARSALAKARGDLVDPLEQVKL